MQRSIRILVILALWWGLCSCQATGPKDGATPSVQTATSLVSEALTTPVEQAAERTPTAEASPTLGGESPPSSDIGAIVLPAECTEPAYEGTPPAWYWAPCSDFAYSPNGRYAGFFFGADNCGRNMYILDTGSGEVVYRRDLGGVHRFEFLVNGKVLLGIGHCEGGSMYLLDPETGEIPRLGSEGTIDWNASRTALAVAALEYVMLERAVWGYNAVEDSLFLPEAQPGEWQLDDHPVWTPDGTHLLFQHRLLSYARQEELYSFPAARQIIRVDATTGEQEVLLGDPRYDFHFCEGSRGGCDPWYGDWIRVRRFPFEAQDIKFSFDFFYDPSGTCLLYGIDCAEAPTLLALNWRTGEVIPWDATVLPTPVPSATPSVVTPLG